MKKKTKTWKLGEICQGGVVTVEVKGQAITIIAKEWDYSKGSNKGSDQSGAKEFDRLELEANEYNAARKVLEYLQNLMHSWAADEIEKWIRGEVVFTSETFW